MANNYTVNIITTSAIPANQGLLDSPQPFPPSLGYKLIITPDTGYIIKATDFLIGNGAYSVSFPSDLIVILLLLLVTNGNILVLELPMVFIKLFLKILQIQVIILIG